MQPEPVEFVFTYLLRSRWLEIYWSGKNCLLKGLWVSLGSRGVRIIPANRFRFWLTGKEPD